MAKKVANLQALELEIKLLQSKIDSNKHHFQELLNKEARVRKARADLEKKLSGQCARLKELQTKYTTATQSQ